MTGLTPPSARLSSDMNSFVTFYNLKTNPGWRRESELRDAQHGLRIPEPVPYHSDLPLGYQTYQGPIMVIGRKIDNTLSSLLFYGLLEGELIWIQLGFRTMFPGTVNERRVLRNLFFVNRGEGRLRGWNCDDIENKVVHSAYVAAAFQADSLQSRDVNDKRKAVTAYCFQRQHTGLIPMVRDYANVNWEELVPKAAPMFLKYKARCSEPQSKKRKSSNCSLPNASQEVSLEDFARKSSGQPLAKMTPSQKIDAGLGTSSRVVEYASESKNGELVFNSWKQPARQTVDLSGVTKSSVQSARPCTIQAVRGEPSSEHSSAVENGKEGAGLPNSHSAKQDILGEIFNLKDRLSSRLLALDSQIAELKRENERLEKEHSLVKRKQYPGLQSLRDIAAQFSDDESEPGV